MVTVDDDLQAVVRDVAQTGPWQLSQSGRPMIATNSVPLSAFGAGSLTLIGGRPVSYGELYRTQPYVAAAVNVLTQQISRLPLKVYERDSQGNRQRVQEHRLVDLLQRPAPRCGPTQLKQWLAQSALLHGNALLLKGRDEKAGPPRRLWPLEWRAVSAKATGGSVEFYETTQFGDKLFLDPENVLHLRWEPPDGAFGVSPLQQLGITVRIERAAQEYQENYLGQGAAPPSALYLPHDIVANDEQRTKIEARMRARHGGPQGAGNVAILPNDTKWDAVGHTAHEAELIAQRKLTREEVGSVYQVPQPLLGILENATLANVAELHRMLYTTVLGPWLTLIEESFKAQVIDPEPAFAGLFVEFDLAEVLKGDKTKETDALKTAVQAGLLTLNEARQVLNLRPYDAEWAGQPLIPANNLQSGPKGTEGGVDLGELTLAAQRLGLAMQNGVISAEEARELIGLTGPTPDDPAEPGGDPDELQAASLNGHH